MTSPDRPVRDSRCLGCMPRILPGPHSCGGAFTLEHGFRCTCPMADCRERQAGKFPADYLRLTKRAGGRSLSVRE